MFVQTLVTRKLQTVTVSKKTVVVDARLGNGYLTGMQARHLPFSSQADITETEPVPAEPRGDQPSAWNTSALWAGRSIGCFGRLSSRFSTPRVGGVVSGGRAHSPLAASCCAGRAKPATRTPLVATRGRIS
jgi:hypothetical protein